MNKINLNRAFTMNLSKTAIISALIGLSTSIFAIEDEYGSQPSSNGADRPMSRSNESLNAVQSAFDKSNESENTRVVTYKVGTTYKVRVREYMQTLIILPEDEKIQGYVLGDKENFSFTPVEGKGNLGSLGAIYPGADTNLTLVGESGSIYSFYVRSDSIDSKQVPDLIVYVLRKASDIYKINRAGRQSGESTADIQLPRATIAAAPKEVNAPTKPEPTLRSRISAIPTVATDTARVKDANAPDKNDFVRSLPDAKQEALKYKIISGSDDIRPTRIYDDGYWTYFEFNELNFDTVSRLPALFMSVDGFDVPVNTRIVGGTIIAEGLNDAWTLWSGTKHVCIRHIDYIPKKRNRGPRRR